MAMAEAADVVVVGAGIMGSCAAYEAARQGRTVLLLEQFDLLHQRGSSHGESRTIRATYPEPFYAKMVVESLRLWLEAEAEAGYRVLTQTPHLDLGPANEPSLRLAMASCTAAGVPVRDLAQGEFSGAFAVPDGWTGAVSGLGGVVKPSKAVAMFQSLAARRGAVIRDQVRVVGIAPGEAGGVRVSAADGRVFLGAKCVVAAGAWTRKLVEQVSGRVLPVQPLHTTICYWKIKRGWERDFSPEKGFPSFASYGEPYVYGTPSMEFPGLVKIALHGGYACDPDERDWSPPLELVEKTLSPWIARMMPGKVEGDKPVITQSCMYSMTPDGDFILDFLGGEFGKDVVVAGGFSGHGFKMGPLVGRILANLAIDGAAAGVDLSPFKLSRFSVNPKGNPKDFADPVASHAPPPSPSMPSSGVSAQL
ncbi:FAD-dependent oxidoreductase family protein [Wolffia australiana]